MRCISRRNSLPINRRSIRRINRRSIQCISRRSIRRINRRSIQCISRRSIRRISRRSIQCISRRSIRRISRCSIVRTGRSLSAQTQPEQPLADFLVRKLNEVGATSRDDLRRLALQEGYFADSDTADRGMHNTLLNVVKAGLIRQLPNGNFAPATMLDTIRLRRAM